MKSGEKLQSRLFWGPTGPSRPDPFGPDLDPKRAILCPNQVKIRSRGGVQRGAGPEG